MFSGSALQGTTPASGWARAGAGSWAIQLPHFQFKVMLKKRKQQVRARSAPRSLSGRPRSIGSVAFIAQPILTIFFPSAAREAGPGNVQHQGFPAGDAALEPEGHLRHEGAEVQRKPAGTLQPDLGAAGIPVCISSVTGADWGLPTPSHLSCRTASLGLAPTALTGTPTLSLRSGTSAPPAHEG